MPIKAGILIRNLFPDVLTMDTGIEPLIVQNHIIPHTLILVVYCFPTYLTPGTR